MDEYIKAFSLGSAAILTNVCLLPLYPGLFVLFAAEVKSDRMRRALPLLGLVVLAGVVVSMTAIAAVLYLFSQTFADVLSYVLPVMYGIVLLLGVLMIAGKNPFERLTTTQIPVIRNPLVGAFVYGVVVAPLTLPCTGPIVLSAFTLGSVAGSGAFLDQLAYFAVFALGFGWPLAVLPILGAGARRQILGLLTKYASPIRIASGLLLVGVAASGTWYYLVPLL